MTLILTTQRLTLRRPATQDWDAYRDFFMSDRAKHFNAQGKPDEIWRMFATTLGHWEIRGYGLWAVALTGDDRCLGLVGPWFPDGWPETEIGWLLFDAALEGTGIVTEAAQATISHAWNLLMWDTMVSYIAPGNTRSIRLAEKLGATLDPDAALPSHGAPTLVYRHTKPGAAQ